MKGNRHNPTGRTKVQGDPAQGPAVWSCKWSALGVDLMSSFAWRALSNEARRVIDRLIIEHAQQGGRSNGALAVTYKDFVLHGLRRESAMLGIAEAEALGLIARTSAGRRAWGAHKGASATYRLTWLGAEDGRPPSNEWKRFQGLREAKDTGKIARAAIHQRAKAAGDKAVGRETRAPEKKSAP